MSLIRLEMEERFLDERLDKYLGEVLADRSRSYVQKLIREGNILVNGRPVKVSYRMEEEDQIEICLPEPEDPEIPAENIPLDILYEDDDVLVVNKPKGMVVHPAAGHRTGTLVNAVLYHCKGRLSGINGVMRPGIVHRIDRDTTGALVVCKNDYAHNHVAEQLKAHTVTRVYTAVVTGVIREEEGTYTDRMQAGDRPYPSDPCAYGFDPPPASGRYRIRGVQRSLESKGPGSACRRSGICPSGHRNLYRSGSSYAGIYESAADKIVNNLTNFLRFILLILSLFWAE